MKSVNCCALTVSFRRLLWRFLALCNACVRLFSRRGLSFRNGRGAIQFPFSPRTNQSSMIARKSLSSLENLIFSSSGVFANTSCPMFDEVVR